MRRHFHVGGGLRAAGPHEAAVPPDFGAEGDHVLARLQVGLQRRELVVTVPRVGIELGAQRQLRAQVGTVDIDADDVRGMFHIERSVLIPVRRVVEVDLGAVPGVAGVNLQTMK